MSISAFQSQRRRTQNVWSCLQPKDIQFPVFEEEREQIPIQEAGIREFWPVFFFFWKGITPINHLSKQLPINSTLNK